MIRKTSSSPFHAFTLVEILVAVGIFFITAIALIALFSVTHKTERDSKEETQAALIASDIMEGLSFGRDPSSLHLATSMSNGVPVWKSISTQSATSCCVAYNSSSEPIRPIPSSEATNPILDQEITAIAWLTLSPNRSIPGIVAAEVIVASPPAAPASGRSLHHFTKLLSIP